MIMGNPPRMLTAAAVREAGVGSTFVNPYGELFMLTVGADDEHYLRPLQALQYYVEPHKLSTLYRPQGVQGVAVGLRLVYKVNQEGISHGAES